MTQQKVLLLEKKGGLFIIGNIDVPTLGAGELVVKVQAAALNPIDWRIQEYGIFYETWPAILGLDMAGDVKAVSKGIEGFSKGDCVLFQAFFQNEFTAFQQFMWVLAEIVGKIPAKLSYSEVASVSLGFMTAAIGLFTCQPTGTGLNPTFDCAIKYTGKPVLVIGGSSSIRQYTIQLLKFNGFSPIITYASEHHTKLLKTLGTMDVVDHSSIPIDELPSAVKAITNDPFEIVFNIVSAPATQNAVKRQKLYLL
ncbi:hypothetical protein WG66_003568 [Moniliophthora roreri]|nr:hypothetical protein WG66_003568 [Moniliophthora roreri]